MGDMIHLLPTYCIDTVCEMARMQVAMQEFGWLATASLVGTATFAPMVLYVQSLSSVSLFTVLQISFASQIVSPSHSTSCLFGSNLRPWPFVFL
jgi:hypothetical protein